MARVFIGVDPHRLSATIEVVDEKETVLATGRFGTDKAGYAAMRKHITSYPDRLWAVEGSNGAGRPLAPRLLADGEWWSTCPRSSVRDALLTLHGARSRCARKVRWLLTMSRPAAHAPNYVRRS